MPLYEINPNNSGTIKLALTGITPLVEYSCQVIDFQVVPTPNLTPRPGTYCEAPADRAGLSSWAIQISFVQDWGNTPSLSEFTFTNDGEDIDYEFTSSNPDTMPSFTGTAQVLASPIGGDAGSAWTATSQNWPCPSKPVLVPAVVVLATADAE